MEIGPLLVAELERIAAEILFIAGALDAKYEGIARIMALRYSTVRLAIIPDAGHNVHFEQAEAFVREVRRFLA
jgi:pimeloyl-ACP methyl ester carboxylesterase